MIKTLLVDWGGYSAYGFTVTLLIQVVRNHRTGKYGSGNRSTWWWFSVAHAIFTAHLWAEGLGVAAAANAVAFLCDVALLAQSYMLEEEGA